MWNKIFIKHYDSVKGVRVCIPREQTLKETFLKRRTIPKKDKKGNNFKLNCQLLISYYIVGIFRILWGDEGGKGRS